MSIVKKGVFAIYKLAALALIAAAFLFGLVSVVYMSLQGSEVKVPEIVGKNFRESETELAALGLKIKKRAERGSTENPDSILEQLPRAGETVKTGQLILVVTAKPNGEGEEIPSTLKKSIQEDDTEKIEQMISDKPKKSKSNSNANANKKTADTTRDVTANTAASTTNSDSADENSNKKEPGTNNSSSDKGNKNTMTGQPTHAAPPSAKPTPGRQTNERPRLINRP